MLNGRKRPAEPPWECRALNRLLRPPTSRSWSCSAIGCSLGVDPTLRGKLFLVHRPSTRPHNHYDSFIPAPSPF